MLLFFTSIFGKHLSHFFLWQIYQWIYLKTSLLIGIFNNLFDILNVMW